LETKLWKPNFGNQTLETKSLDIKLLKTGFWKIGFQETEFSGAKLLLDSKFSIPEVRFQNSFLSYV